MFSISLHVSLTFEAEVMEIIQAIEIAPLKIEEYMDELSGDFKRYIFSYITYF